ncbi:MAG: M28 family peptidase [Thermoanaerobaculia bacterium]|nr:M28 family peptidase [Thermoanaerobaculia bacterium]
MTAQCATHCPPRGRRIALILGIALFLTSAGSSLAAEIDGCVVAPTDGLGHEVLVGFEATASSDWVELGEDLLLCGSSQSIARDLGQLADRTEARGEFHEPPRLFDGPRQDLILVEGYRSADSSNPTEVVAQGGRLAVVRRSTADLYTDLPLGHGHTTAREIPWNRVLVRLGENLAPRYPRRELASPRIQGLVTSIDGPRWLADVATLSSWSRHSTRSGTEIALARDWIYDQLEALPGFTVELDPFQLGASTIHNIIGTLTGSTRPEEIVVVGGHYDATSQSGTLSPGAEDNASGCAGVIELARAFSSHPPPVTMLFVCYSGEEQGLNGSEHQVDELQASGDDERVIHMLNMDMIGYTADADLDCLLETEDEFADLLTPYAEAAAAHTTLRIVTSLFAFGSDHVPFIDAGMPGLLTIENDWDQYPDYHSSGDVIANVDLDMGYQTLRMNVAALATLMDFDQSLFSDGFESGDATAWTQP